MADPNLQIRGDAWSSRPWDKGGGAVSKKNFSALWASVWSKNKRGGRGMVPSPGSATASQFTMNCLVYSGLNKFNKPHDTNFTRVISRVVNQAAFIWKQAQFMPFRKHLGTRKFKLDLHFDKVGIPSNLWSLSNWLSWPFILPFND